MRFVSHEVRTPLNAVSMGLSVIQAEIATSLGYVSVRDLQEQTGDGDIFQQETQLTRIGRCGTSEKKSINVTKSDALEWFRLSQDILHNTNSAVEVLSDVLNYDKIESGTLVLDLAEVSIWHILEETMNEFKLSANKKRIEFTLSFSSLETGEGGIGDTEGQQAGLTFSSTAELQTDFEQAKIFGDTVRLTQVLRNVISNALKFTPEGGSVQICALWHQQTLPTNNTDRESKKRRIHLGKGGSLTRSRYGFVEIVIKDSGAGMTQSQLANLFQEGMQFNANELQQGKGSGFGLFISKGIVELHEGALRAKSDGPDRGTTFTMELPLYHSPGAEKSPPTTRLNASFSMSPSEKASLSILVVDDALSNRKLLSRLLTKAGHRCDLAEDGKVALQNVKEKMACGDRYDTLILDYEMPVMNGPTAAKEIRRAGSDVFIVAVTGNMLQEDIDYFYKCGANAVLPKPFQMSALEELWMEHGVLDEVL